MPAVRSIPGSHPPSAYSFRSLRANHRSYVCLCRPFGVGSDRAVSRSERVTESKTTFARVGQLGEAAEAAYTVARRTFWRINLVASRAVNSTAFCKSIFQLCITMASVTDIVDVLIIGAGPAGYVITIDQAFFKKSYTIWSWLTDSQKFDRCEFLQWHEPTRTSYRQEVGPAGDR